MPGIRRAGNQPGASGILSKHTTNWVTLHFQPSWFLIYNFTRLIQNYCQTLLLFSPISKQNIIIWTPRSQLYGRRTMCNIYFIVYSANSEQCMPEDGSIPSRRSCWSHFCFQMARSGAKVILLRLSNGAHSHRLHMPQAKPSTAQHHRDTHSGPYGASLPVCPVAQFMSLPQWSSLKRFSLWNKADVHYEGKGVSNRSVFLRCPPNPAVVTAGHPAAIRLSFLCGLSLWLLL